MTVDADWMRWQREHTGALQALQEAQRAYHRALAGHPPDAAERPLIDVQKETLRAVDAARIHLDEVRARQPQ